MYATKSKKMEKNMAQEKLVLGFDVGGTKIGVGLGSSEGRILGKAVAVVGIVVFQWK